MSASFPPPPDFLRMAMEAQQMRRQQEQERLQQLMAVENLRQNAIRQGQDAISQGIDVKDALGMLSYKDPIVEAQLKAMQGAAQKQKELQQNQQAAQGMMPGLQRLATEAPNTEAYGQGVSQLAQFLGPDAAPILESLSAQSQMAPTLGALDQIRAEQEEASALKRLVRQERVKGNEQLRVYRSKKEVDRLGRLLDDQITKATALYSTQVAEMMSEGLEVDPSEIAKAIQDDPVLGGEQAPAYTNLILMEASSSARMNQPAVDVRESIETRLGIKVPMNVARFVADGKAMEEPFSGIPMMAATSGERVKIASGGAALSALADVFVSAQQVVASNSGGGRTSEMRLAPTMRGLGMANSLPPEVQAYDAARTIVGGLISKTLTGTQNAEKETARYMNLLPTVAELRRDPKTGGLDKTSLARLEQAYRTTLGFISGASLIDDHRTRAAMRRAFDARVISLNPPEPPALLRRPGTGGSVRGGQDPRFPVIR